MAFLSQVLLDGHLSYIVKVTGTAPDAAAALINVATMVVPCEALSLWQVQYDIAPGGVVSLLWDATTDVVALTMSEGPGQTLCMESYGGIPNNAGAGVTGNVLITSTGAGVYTLILWFHKRNPRIPL